MGDPPPKMRFRPPGASESEAPQARLVWAAVGILAITFALQGVGWALAFSQAARSGVVPPQVVKALTIGPLAGLLFAGISLFQIKWNPVPWWTPAFRRAIVLLDVVTVLLSLFLVSYGVPVATAWPESNPTLSYFALLGLPIVLIVVVLLWGWWLVLYFRLVGRLVGGE